MTQKSTTTAAPTKWLPTTQAAVHFDISVSTLARWPGMKGFPDDGHRLIGAYAEYECAAVGEWLKTRPASRRRPHKFKADGVAA